MRKVETNIAILWVLSILFSATSINGFSQQDEKKLLSVNKFIEQLKKNHPVAKQALLQVSMSEADLLSAKGGFDPEISIDGSSKTFDGKNYYYYTNPELTIPLPIGNLRSGLENNGGDYLSSEITTGKSSYFGIELPLAKGLIIDKRRAAVSQAKLLVNKSKQEQLQILNNLLFEAYQRYWDWSGSYESYHTYKKFIDAADQRLRLIRIGFHNGDRSAMDTLEAHSQWQTFQIGQREALIKMNKAAFELNNYLWNENDTAWLLTEYHIPEPLSSFTATKRDNDDILIYLSEQQNPVFKAYDLKIQSLEVDRKLQSQNLLPYFTVKANLLYKDYSLFKTIDPVYVQNNYKWGFDLRMPLFLRQERGKYRKAQLKIKETNLELVNKKQQINNKIRSFYNESKQLEQQLTTIENIRNNYQTLLRNEELRLSQGESSLFMVNNREIKVVEAMNKKIELSLKYINAKNAAEWAAGVLQ
jgi:outer membrane protein TolC